MDIFRLPNPALRRIYDRSDNKTKRSLFHYYESEDKGFMLQDAGCLLYKESFSCFLCQLELHFEEMCEQSLNRAKKRRDKLNFHLFFASGGERLTMRHFGFEEQILERYFYCIYPSVSHIHNISVYYVQRLANVFSTSNMDDFAAHLKTHSLKNYYPDKFKSKHDLDYSVHRAVTQTLHAFKEMQECGGRFPELHLVYDWIQTQRKIKKVELVPEYRALQGFNMFINNFEPIRSHPGLFLYFSKNIII